LGKPGSGLGHWPYILKACAGKRLDSSRGFRLITQFRSTFHPRCKHPHRSRGPLLPPGIPGVPQYYGPLRIPLRPWGWLSHPLAGSSGPNPTGRGSPLVGPSPSPSMLLASYPGGQTGWLLSISPSIMSLPEVGAGRGSSTLVFEGACSAFQLVTSCWIVGPHPRGGLLSRGFDPGRCPHSRSSASEALSELARCGLLSHWVY